MLAPDVVATCNGDVGWASWGSRPTCGPRLVAPGGAGAGPARLDPRVTLAHMCVEEQIRSAAEDRASALAAGDVERLSELLHEDFRWTTHLGETYNRMEYVRRNTGGHTVWRSQDLSDVEVVVVGDTAVLHAEVTDVVMSQDGEPETFRMPMTQVWVRQGGDWTCLAGHAGPRRS